MRRPVLAEVAPGCARASVQARLTGSQDPSADIGPRVSNRIEPTLFESEAPTTGGPKRILGLVCRECGSEYPAGPTHVCEMCFGPLDVSYDYEVVAERISREGFEHGPTSIWRYRHLLPVDDEVEVVTMEEGWTPLLHARNLGSLLGLDRLYLKLEGGNPTNSFKDRLVSVAVSWAKSRGFDTVACASTGNLANSVAAYAAQAGLRCFVFVPADLEPQKMATTRAFAPHVVAVRGNYDDVNRLCAEAADTYGWAFCNINLRPFYSEGAKTMTFEVLEQLGWRMPDEIVIPVASGCQFVKHRRALHESLQLGLVEGAGLPRMTGAQALGCSPVYAAFQAGTEVIVPVKP